MVGQEAIFSFKESILTEKDGKEENQMKQQIKEKGGFFLTEQRPF